MSLKMVSCLLLAISATLLVAASATTTSSDNIIGEEGVIKCIGDLPKLFDCKKEIVDFFKKGKVAIGQQCCVAVTATVTDCLQAALQYFGIPTDKSDVLTGFCRAAYSPTAAPAPAPAIAAAPTPGPL